MLKFENFEMPKVIFQMAGFLYFSIETWNWPAFIAAMALI